MNDDDPPRSKALSKGVRSETPETALNRDPSTTMVGMRALVRR